MAKEKIYKPRLIEDKPFPFQQGDASFSSGEKSTKDVFKSEKIENRGLPSRRIAVELIGSALNTKSRVVLGTFKLEQSGGFQIGQYVNGVTGDLRITPNGVVGRNKAGIITFSINSTTGDAVFRGSIQSGTVITGKVIVGNNTWIIDGNKELPRILLYNDGVPEIILGEI